MNSRKIARKFWRRQPFATSLMLLVLTGCAATPSTKLVSETNVASATAKGCELLPDQDRSTIVIFEPSSGRKLVCNDVRSRQRFVPASTFKIPHALIALETRAVADENSKFEWDGQRRGVAAWDKSLSMADAIPASAVWVFQQIATKIGHPAEGDWVSKLEYGNKNVGAPTNLKHFWLSGPLKISAVEQVRFLERLHSGNLPVARDHVIRTISLLQIEKNHDDSMIYGKTGAMLPIDDEGFLKSESQDLLPVGTERTGWFVGWIERKNDMGGPVFFALNLDLDLPDAMNARTAVAYAILNANDIKAPLPKP